MDHAALTPERLTRLRETSARLTALIAAAGGQALVRPSPTAWSAAEIACHLRDIEEAYLDRMRFILMNDAPRLSLLDPDRWVEERQYRRCDAGAALAAFRARREDTFVFVESLAPDQWERGADHPARGRLTIRRIVHSLARHDAEHLDQAVRAVAGLA